MSFSEVQLEQMKIYLDNAERKVAAVERRIEQRQRAEKILARAEWLLEEERKKKTEEAIFRASQAFTNAMEAINHARDEAARIDKRYGSSSGGSSSGGSSCNHGGGGYGGSSRSTTPNDKRDNAFKAAEKRKKNWRQGGNLKGDATLAELQLNTLLGKIEAIYNVRGEDPPFGLPSLSSDALREHQGCFGPRQAPPAPVTKAIVNTDCL